MPLAPLPPDDGPDPLPELREALADAAADAARTLLAAGATVATAESLTGGMLGAALTAVPGVSAAYRGGVVSYATDLKHALLGVDADLLAREGAVHPDVARAMALGVRDRLGADWGIATTGVAGPDPQDGRPAGTVYVAVAGAAGSAGPVAVAYDASGPASGLEPVRLRTGDDVPRLLAARVAEAG
ncbi:CinA family protein [Angustibacter aerolatus]